MGRWLVDGNNVMGAVADGWWRDRRGAASRLTTEIDRWATTAGHELTVVFDGDEHPLPEVSIVVHFAAPADADDIIAELSQRTDEPYQVIVTSDRGLRRRLGASSTVLGAGAFRARLTEGG